MKKIVSSFLLAVSLIGSGIFAADNAAIIQAIKANPSLLDSAEAKRYIGSVPSSTPLSVTAVQEQPKNEVVVPAVAETKSAETAPVVKARGEALTRSPLSIEDNDEIVSRLKSRQMAGASKEVPLNRYGMEFFSNKNGLDLASLPVPENYKIVPKDVVSVILYGPKSDNLSLTVDKDGNVVIPSFGPLRIAGLSFSDAKKTLTDALMAAYPNVGVTVNIAQFSTIQVTLAGEVATPGLYNLSSFSTIKEALIAAGGLAKNGSMREVQIKRGGRVVTTVDLYRIIRGTGKSYEYLLKAGDVIVVPIAGKSVTIDGYIKRPAIYEVKSSEKLSDLIKYAGGLSASANKNDIRITRYEGHQKLKVISLSSSEAAKKSLMDQDAVYVYGLDKSNLSGITLYGSVVKPGFWPLSKEGMSVGEFFKREIAQNTLRGVFLEETYFDYAIIKRIGSNLKEEVIGFSLSEALNGSNKIALHSRDELYILNRSLVEEKPIVKISGECVSRAGEYKYFDKMSLDALLLTAGTNCPIDQSKITIVSRDVSTLRPSVRVVDMSHNNHIALHPFDEVNIIGFYTTNPIQEVSISGEVFKPGRFKIDENGTTLKDIILASGNVTDKASRDKIELLRHEVIDGKRVRTIQTMTLAQAMSADSPRLKKYDEITVFKVPQWNERKSVKIYGKVNYPGEYAITDGDTLSMLLRRAGGVSRSAYSKGAVFTREDVKKFQREGMERQVKDLEQRILFAASQPTQAGQVQGDQTQLLAMLSTLKAEIKNTELMGRLAINLDELSRDPNSPSNIILKNGDTLYVPEREDSVMVQGEVLNPNAIVYNPAFDLDDYLSRAGGIKESADESSIFIVHANGEAETFKSNYLFGSSTVIGAGDVIVVPMQISTYSGMQFAKDITAILYQLAVSAAAIKTVGGL